MAGLLRTEAMKKRLKHNCSGFRKVALVLAVMAASSFSTYAIDAYISNLYREIDIAFLNKSESELNKLLSANSASLNYYLLENYTMKKIRHLVIDEEYEFALQANLVVIDNDLNYTDAVEMYSIIASALEKKKEQERLVEAKRQAELAKLEEEKEKKRVAAEKEFNAVITPEGKKVYVQDKKEVYTADYWNFRFGLADLNYLTEASHDYNSFRYGIAMEGSYEYSFNKLILGVDGSAELNFPSFGDFKSTQEQETEYFESKPTGSGESSGQQPTSKGFNDDVVPTKTYQFAIAEESLPMNLILMPKLGFHSGETSWYARAGFAWLGNFASGHEILCGHLFSPAVGVGFSRLKLGAVTLGANADFYVTSLIKTLSPCNIAGGGELNMSVPISAMEKARLTFNIGLKDTVFVKDQGIENRARLVLAIGAENVAK